MSRDDRPMRVPKYRRHPNGQAMVQYRSKRYYLGKYGTAESRKRYQAFLSRIEESAPTAAELESVGRDVTIAKLIFLYSAYCRDYYGASPEYNNLIQALRPLEKLWGLTLGRDFGPRKLIAVRDHMVRSGLARKNINRLVSRIKRFWRWCCMMELVPQEIYHGLLSVSPLMPGRCNVRESPEVLPVPLDVVRATLPWLSPTIRALVQVQLYCGMRPSEACRMRGADIDTSGPVWLYRPPKHKGAWRNKPRVIAVPKVAQDILRSLMPDDSERYIFSPREAERQRMEARAEAAARTGKQRKTKVYPCELRRRAREKLARRARERKRPLRDTYDFHAYRRAIVYGLKRAKRAGIEIPHWHPYQLRHAIATEVSQVLGDHAAQRWLGHDQPSTTGIYIARQTVELLAIAEQLQSRWEASQPLANAGGPGSSTPQSPHAKASAASAG